MNNTNAQVLINDCLNELNDIKNIIDKIGQFDNKVPYLTKYSIIKCCGTIEQSFKTIIADYCETGSSPQLKNYLFNKFRNYSRNPSIENIHRSLIEFDTTWNNKFKIILKCFNKNEKLTTSIKSLNDARNEFAHGGNPNLAFSDVFKYFNDSIIIMNIIDGIIV